MDWSNWEPIDAFAAAYEANAQEIYQGTGMIWQHQVVEDATRILQTQIVLSIPNFWYLDMKHSMNFE